MSLRKLFIACGFLGLLLAGSSSVLAAITQNYLPTLPVTTAAGKTISTYGSATNTQFTQTVTCMGANIGQFSFTYNTYTGTTAGGTPTGGAALAGAFYPTVAPMAGYVYGWVQVVSADTPGSDGINTWGVTKTNPPTPYPDTGSSKSDPDYPAQSIPVALTGANPPQPMPGYQDFPNRFPGDGNWTATLGLVCKNLTTHVMDVIGTFTWGFSMALGPVLGVTANAPANWTTNINAAQNTGFAATLASYFNGKNGSTMWTVGVGCCTPEPGSLIIWTVISVVGVAIVRRQKSAGKKQDDVNSLAC